MHHSALSDKILNSFLKLAGSQLPTQRLGLLANPRLSRRIVDHTSLKLQVSPKFIFRPPILVPILLDRSFDLICFRFQLFACLVNAVENFLELVLFSIDFLDFSLHPLEVVLLGFKFHFAVALNFLTGLDQS